MRKNVLSSLNGLIDSRANAIGLWIFSTIAGLSVGLLLILFGWFWELLAFYSRSGVLSESILLGPRLALASHWIEADQGILRGATALLLMIVVLLAATILLVFISYKMAAAVGIENAHAQQQAVFDQLQIQSRHKGVANLQPLVQQLIAQDIPAIRDATVRWYRHGPHHLMQMAACFLVAIIIDPPLACLAIIVAALAKMLFSAIDRRRRRSRPVSLERRNLAALRLADWSASSPLLATVDNAAVTRESFESQSKPLRTFEHTLDDQLIWKMPITTAVIGLLSCALMFAAAVRVLRPELQLSVIAVIILLSAIAIAIFSAARATKAAMAIDAVQTDVDHLVTFLSQKLRSEDAAADSVRNIGRLDLDTVKRIDFQQISLRDHSDAIIVSQLNASLQSGELIAIVSDQPVCQRAVADLLLGFGKPATGQLRLDGIDSLEIGSTALAKISCWVSTNGPIFSNTVIANLQTSQQSEKNNDQVLKVLKATFAHDAIANLSDGLATIITADDDRFGADIAFRLGLARAMLLDSSIVVVQEPPSLSNAQIETESIQAMRTVADQNSIVVVMPNRSKTLWACDRVLFLNNNRLAAMGKHAAMLEQNDAYRHWNYMQFSPHLEPIRKL